MNKPVELLKPVEGIAREAGRVLMDYYGKIRQIDYKGVGDIVTEADKAAETLITKRLESLFPGSAVLGEEFGMSAVKSDDCWVIDPLDGTANYAASLPIFAVAIALLHRGAPTLGVVFDPNTDRMFSGTKGGGATLNGMPIQVNDREKLDAIGLFGFSAGVIESLHPFMRKSAKGRSLGSAALHICSVATGYFDGSFDPFTKLWDVAAPAMILEEAGGVITQPSGAPLFPLPTDSPAYQGENVPFLATNGRVHEECLRVLQEVEN
ncbi:MAG: inositol monophosphatase family protein [Candidatus Poribacteria bacterium]|nr:inositol monophosphatase family protein [Candidatus Poribacteria bacterium]